MSAGLPWLVKSFGLADRIVDMKDGKPYIYPAVFELNQVDPIPLLPSDAWDSFSFWVKSEEATIDSEGSFVSKNPLLTYNVSCIFYMDINKSGREQIYKESKSKIIEDIFHFFNTVHVQGKLAAKKFIEDDITKVFEGFTLDQLDNRWKMYPKWACRMEFEYSIRDECYNSVSST
jgi:hypothetical protein